MSKTDLKTHRGGGKPMPSIPGGNGGPPPIMLPIMGGIIMPNGGRITPCNDSKSYRWKMAQKS